MASYWTMGQQYVTETAVCYRDLLELECRRLETRLSLLYKIIYKLCYYNLEGVSNCRT